jgi:hypothetical protein
MQSRALRRSARLPDFFIDASTPQAVMGSAHDGFARFRYFFSEASNPQAAIRSCPR